MKDFTKSRIVIKKKKKDQQLVLSHMERYRQNMLLNVSVLTPLFSTLSRNERAQNSYFIYPLFYNS